MTKALTYGLLAVGLLSLAADWTMAGYWQVGLALLVLTPLSLYLVKRRFIPALGLSLALTVLTAAFGLWVKIDLPLALLAVFCILAAWDLDNFSRRLAYASAEDHPASIEREHLLWVGLVLLLAAALSYLSPSIRIETNFERAVLLVIVMFAGIGALVGWLRRKESY
jgi:hypothetical protein